MRENEVNIISWNGCAHKIDIRDWDPSHEHMSPRSNDIER